MADRVTKEQRSKNMAAVKAKDTKPEKIVRSFLHAHGFRYSLFSKKIPGKPDMVLRKYKTLIFVNGCFWHGHDCKKGTLPKTNPEFWKEKIDGNKERDRKNKIELKKLGWNVIIVWECQISEEYLTELCGRIKNPSIV